MVEYDIGELGPYELAEPRASSLAEALRSVGYTVQTAIADLIDNSITARAHNVWLQFIWAGQASWISVTDDGLGMEEVELSSAMRPGSRSPLEPRPPEDLGRFGLGLKTASFSQARRLTVASKRSGGSIALRTWDLDYVGRTGEWRLLTKPGTETLARLEPLSAMRQGTAVLWENLDRVTDASRSDDRAAHDRFLRVAHSVDDHLAMVFHRFLTGARPTLLVFMNGSEDRHRIRPWDPFCEQHLATFSPSDAERLLFHGGEVLVKGFVLPHKDKLTEQEYAAAAGPAGWNAQQGFYIYRNRRLLVPGGWLGLEGYTNEEHHKLARIRVDIPNSTDSEWAIDIKKSRARPPAVLRQRLKEVGDLVRQRAREIYAHRGRSIADPQEPLRRAWLPAMREGRLCYRIDRTHPLARLVLADASPPQRSAIEALLRLLEATVPIQQIWLDAAEKPERHASPFEHEPPAHIGAVMTQLFRALRADGISAATARQRIASMDPFDRFPELLASLTETKEDT